MFDIGLGEIIALAAVALLIFGPDQLPKAAAQAGRFLRDIRAMATSARQELSDSAGMDEISKDLKSLTDLHPKRIMSSVWEDPAKEDGQGRPSKPAAPSATQGSAAPSSPAVDPTSPPAAKPQAPSPSPSFDPDAT